MHALLSSIASKTCCHRFCPSFELLYMHHLVASAADIPTTFSLLITQILYSLRFLASSGEQPRTQVACAEAQAFAALLPSGMSHRPLEFRRTLASASALEIALPAPLTAELHQPLENPNYMCLLRDTETCLDAVTKLFPGSTRFDAVLDATCPHIVQLHRVSDTPSTSTKLQATVGAGAHGPSECRC
eukprot:jgi/Ulvmu1/1814/UM119_0032.1